MKMRRKRREHTRKPHLADIISVPRMRKYFDLVLGQIERGREFKLAENGRVVAVLVPVAAFEGLQEVLARATSEIETV